MNREKISPVHRIRVLFEYADESFLYVRFADADDGKLRKVRYGVDQMNDEFTGIIPLLWKGARLNILDVKIGFDECLTPSFIVLEPDYLIDVSTLAECYRDYGNHPANYLLSRFLPIENARPLLLGNIANMFLDEWIYAGEEEPVYREVMQKVFKQYPLELVACEELRVPEVEKAFAADCKQHFEHIRQTVLHTFGEPVYRLDKSDAVLEPSYICEPLGIQGRLDYMQRNGSGFIEMKSGKADELSVKGKVVPRVNHRVQMLLYMAMLEFCVGHDHHRQHPYLLYTRYPLLYPARSSWAQVKRIIHLRNLIVASEYGTQIHNHPHYTARLLSQITPDTLNIKHLRGRFWDEFLRPQIQRFGNELNAMDEVEQLYFYSHYNFITKELYLSKAGRQLHEGKMGMAGMWLNSFDEKREAGEILYDLQILENGASLPSKPFVRLSVPDCGEDFLPNFRVGDVVVLYERNELSDNVTNKMVFKGSIETITDVEVCIRLRASQRNLSVFPPQSLYAIEHDSMDTTFRSMYYGLWAFLQANPERRTLLMGRRLPEADEAYDAKIALSIDDFERVAWKAKAAKDYFLLVGPPGTGKTSRALRRMVELFYSEPHTQILLSAYTNRAVDEICQSLSSIAPGLDYIRVGSELACDERFRNKLLENVISPYTTRREVMQRIDSCRIFVGTVSTLSAKPELFRLKVFDVAIIDEATQILESQLLPILCARTPQGLDAIGKFVLIGDHKQLPAVVLQESYDSEVHDESLRRLGIYNLKDSLFERLYRKHTQSGDMRCVDMLCRQGRMHPLVAEFPNAAFYENRLLPVGLEHQKVSMKSAVFYIPSQPDDSSLYGKTNRMEAKIVAEWALQIYKEYGDSFDANRSLGIITPYRNQIALIRKALRQMQIPALESITVDTVERYQGSERDVIIYSFCLNHSSQLDLLPNLTEDNGVLVDRKLNVALTRARKRIYITGAPQLMRQNAIYSRLLDYLDNLTL